MMLHYALYFCHNGYTGYDGYTGYEACGWQQHEIISLIILVSSSIAVPDKAYMKVQAEVDLSIYYSYCSYLHG